MSLSICLSVSFVQCLLVFTCLFLKDLLHQLFLRARPQSTSLPYPLRSCIYRVVCFIPNYVAITQFASSSKLYHFLVLFFLTFANNSLRSAFPIGLCSFFIFFLFLSYINRHLHILSTPAFRISIFQALSFFTLLLHPPFSPPLFPSLHSIQFPCLQLHFIRKSLQHLVFLSTPSLFPLPSFNPPFAPDFFLFSFPHNTLSLTWASGIIFYVKVLSCWHRGLTRVPEINFYRAGND